MMALVEYDTLRDTAIGKIRKVVADCPRLICEHVLPTMFGFHAVIRIKNMASCQSSGTGLGKDCLCPVLSSADIPRCSP